MNPGRRAVIRANSVWIRALYRLLGGLSVHGMEHVPRTGAVLLASNHLSWADPPALVATLPRASWFMANHELFDIPILGKLLAIHGAFPVHRGQIDREAIREAERHLKDGDLVGLFPEGGTTITGRLYPFEGGAALLALRAGVPVLPCAITGSDRLWPEGKKPRYAKGGVTIRFGPLIRAGDLDAALPRRERVERLTQRIYDAIAAMLPPEYLPAPGEAPPSPAMP